MAQSIDATYPTVARWVNDCGWLEIGQEHLSRSFIRALEEGGMVWEGQEHQSLGSHETQKSAKEGVMALRAVRLLFVCIGNTCRSPLAAAVASALLGSRVHAESAGVTETGCPAASDAIAVLQERFGMDLSTHRSRHLDEVALDQFDILIALDPIVYAPLRERCPIPPPEILLWPVHDPYLEGLDAYHQCLAELQTTIEAHAPQWLEELA